ncbi:MAG: hypothetical protein IAI48_02080, partial [Candidatus Eremiobacteraeota bacterium]|nr:hypothetical protein [Candidatus Eremiobacteraeota bacterium]
MPVLIGVIVLGFVIGAGLSLAGKHASPDAAPTRAATIPPALGAPASPTPLVAQTPTPESSPSDEPSPSPSPSPRASRRPS